MCGILMTFIKCTDEFNLESHHPFVLIVFIPFITATEKGELSSFFPQSD